MSRYINYDLTKVFDRFDKLINLLLSQPKYLTQKKEKKTVLLSVTLLINQFSTAESNFVTCFYLNSYSI